MYSFHLSNPKFGIDWHLNYFSKPRASNEKINKFRIQIPLITLESIVETICAKHKTNNKEPEDLVETKIMELIYVIRGNGPIEGVGFFYDDILIIKGLPDTYHIILFTLSVTPQGLQAENDQEPEFFGEYEYKDNGISLQYFSVQNKAITRPYQIIELRVESNHGHQTYTCLYRFRVHGKTANS